MMAHFAEIENGIVTRVLVVDNSITDGQNYLANELGLGGIWVQTSYNTHAGVHTNGGTPLHKNYAGIGYSWDGVGFASPQCHPEAVLNQDTYIWDCANPAHSTES